MWVFLALLSAIFVSLLLGFWFARKYHQWQLINRLSIALTPVVLLLISSSVFNQILIRFSAISWTQKGTWSPIRLLPAFAIARHYPLYADTIREPIIGMIYGPMMAVAYLPAVLANSPAVAMAVGSLLSTTFYCLPVLWLIFCDRSNKTRHLLPTLLAFGLFVFLTVFSPVLRYVAFSIHADAPALGLSATACVILCCRKRPDNLVALFLSAICAILAIWTKQVTVPILVALPLYLLLTEGRRCFQQYLFCLGLSGCLISALILMSFEPQSLFFNMFAIPGHHPWRNSDRVLILMNSSWELFISCSWPLLILMFSILFNLKNNKIFLKSGSPPPISIKRSKKHLLEVCRGGFHRFLLNCTETASQNPPNPKFRNFNQQPQVFFAIVGLFLSPTSILGRVKEGGDVNALSYTLYFLSIAALLVLIEWFSMVKFSKYLPKTSATLTVCYSAFLLTQMLKFPSHTIELSQHFTQAFHHIQNHPTQMAYQYVKKHPGEAYFPWQTLANVMAEGKMYHFEYGLFDRELAGFPASDRHFRAGLPANLQLIAFYSRNDGYVLHRLPEFSRQIELDELPGWKIYTREN